MASRKLELEIRKLENCQIKVEIFSSRALKMKSCTTTQYYHFLVMWMKTHLYSLMSYFFLRTRFPVPQAMSCARLLCRAPLHASGGNGHFDMNGIYHYGQTDPVEMGGKPINETAKMFHLGNQGGRIGYTGK